MMNFLYWVWYGTRFWLWICVCWNRYTAESLSLWKFPTHSIYQTQWKSIHTILTHPRIPFEMKQTVRKKIFVRYFHWASFCAWKFKKTHPHKCRSIRLDEMANYAHLGLWKAVQQYNGNSSFHYYVNLYVQGEMYEGLSLLYPICKVSKNERKKKKHTTEHNMTTYLSRREYKRKLNTQFVGNNEWIFDKYDEALNQKRLLPLEKYQEKEWVSESWKPIHSLSPFQKRVFQLKYNAQWEKIRSNHDVAVLMACSEEYVRKTLMKWHQS